MSQNDDYFQFIEGQRSSEQHLQSSDDVAPSPQAKGIGLKIVVLVLIGLCCLALLVYIIKEVVVLFIGLVFLGILLGLFARASEKGG